MSGFAFDLGRGRSGGAHWRPAPGARVGADSRLHAGRNGGDRESDAAGIRRRNRRRYRAREHLSSDAAARCRAHREARRAAQIHELAVADPDRFRRVSGHVAVQPARHIGGGRPLPVAHRWIGTFSLARTRHGDPAPARLRHPDGARRMSGLPCDRSRDRILARALDALGEAVQGRVRGRRRPVSASSRAASIRICANDPYTN